MLTERYSILMKSTMFLRFSKLDALKLNVNYFYNNSET